MSGVFDIRPFVNGYYDDNVYFNNTMDYMANANDPELWKMGIVLGTAEHDICRPDNENMSSLLARKDMRHWLDIRSNATHDWPVWRAMFPHYLSLL
jgi:esterase/lipase superfamily enzyme